MVRKQHTSAKGVPINFDELTRKNSTVLAVGNVRMNARGDRLGPSGKVIQKVEDIPSYKRPDPDGPYSTTNKKSIKLVSLKDDLTTDTLRGKALVAAHKAEDAKTPDELIKELDARKAAKIEAAQEAAKKPEVENNKSTETSRNKRKLVDSED